MSLLTLLSGGGGGGGVVPKDPVSAPDDDYLHLLDYSDDDRVTLDVPSSTITHCYTAKDKKTSTTEYFSAVIGLSPLSVNTINGLRCGTYESLGRRHVINSSAPADIEYMYPSMTMFCVVQPRSLITQAGIFISDYGSDLSKLIYVKLGDGAALNPFAYMRDTSGNAIQAFAVGAGVPLSLNTTYLLVIRFDGANKQCDFWIDGDDNKGTDTNASYDPTTTWEGKATASAVPTVGALSNGGSNPLDGYIGEIFTTKTALSDADINSYAQFIASKWGTTWVNI